MIPKLYSNTLTLILNNRINIQGGRDDTDSGNGTVSLWSTNTTPSWRVRAGSKREDPTAPTASENAALHEAWSEGTNSAHIEAVSSSPTIYSNESLMSTQEISNDKSGAASNV